MDSVFNTPTGNGWAQALLRLGIGLKQGQQAGRLAAGAEADRRQTAQEQADYHKALAAAAGSRADSYATRTGDMGQYDRGRINAQDIANLIRGAGVNLRHDIAVGSGVIDPNTPPPVVGNPFAPGAAAAPPGVAPLPATAPSTLAPGDTTPSANPFAGGATPPAPAPATPLDPNAGLGPKARWTQMHVQNQDAIGQQNANANTDNADTRKRAMWGAALTRFQKSLGEGNQQAAQDAAALNSIMPGLNLTVPTYVNSKGQTVVDNRLSTKNRIAADLQAAETKFFGPKTAYENAQTDFLKTRNQWMPKVWKNSIDTKTGTLNLDQYKAQLGRLPTGDELFQLRAKLRTPDLVGHLPINTPEGAAFDKQLNDVQYQASTRSGPYAMPKSAGAGAGAGNGGGGATTSPRLVTPPGAPPGLQQDPASGDYYLHGKKYSNRNGKKY